MRILLALLFVLFLSACSDTEAIRPSGSSGEGSEESPQEDVAPKEIFASKSYSPNQWQDYNASFNNFVEIELAALADVLNGQSGNHWITLKLNTNIDSIVCIYKGNGNNSKTNGSCNGANGDAYIFEYCTDRQSYTDLSCDSNPFKSSCVSSALNIVAGDILKVNFIDLSVNNGDMCDATQVRMSL